MTDKERDALLFMNIVATFTSFPAPLYYAFHPSAVVRRGARDNLNFQVTVVLMTAPFVVLLFRGDVPGWYEAGAIVLVVTCNFLRLLFGALAALANNRRDEYHYRLGIPIFFPRVPPST